MPNKQPKNFIKSLQIIPIFLVVSVIVFAAFVAFNAKEQLFFSYKEGKVFLYVAIIIAYVGNLASKNLYKKLIKQILEGLDLLLKETKFSTAHIFRLVMLEFPAFMCIIFVLQSNNSFYFILVGILVLMMVIIYPAKIKFKNDVPLSTIEKSMLEKL